MSRLTGLLPEEDYLCYWHQLKYLLFAIALAVQGKKKMLHTWIAVLSYFDV